METVDNVSIHITMIMQSPVFKALCWTDIKKPNLKLKNKNMRQE